MKRRLAAAAAIFLSVGGMPIFAHRLDEYLQATTISVERDRLQAQICLTPGIAVFSIVLATIDTDADGIISEAEQAAYADRMLGDLSLMLDGDRLLLRLKSSKFASTEEMKEGRGDIIRRFASQRRLEITSSRPINWIIWTRGFPQARCLSFGDRGRRIGWALPHFFCWHRSHCSAADNASVNVPRSW
jgi:hypothetical protein